VRSGRLFVAELRNLLGLAGPIIVSQLGQVGMNTADTIMVGPLGGEALAAAGLGSALHIFTIMLCTGVIIGMAPLVSQAFGAGEGERCNRILVQGLWLAVVLAIPVTIVTLYGEAIALRMGQDPRVAALAGGYMRALAWGVLPTFLFMAFRQYLEGMGIVKPVMVITFIGLGANIISNRLLIYGVEGWIPGLGIVGTGWATTIVRWTMLLAVLFYLLRHSELRPFSGVSPLPEWGLLRRVVGLGLPVGGQLGMEIGLFSFTAVMMGWLGTVPLGAHQVTMNIASTTFMVALGSSLAGSVRVGQQIGAQSPAGVRRAALGTYLLAAGFMSICVLLFLALPSQLIELYTSDPAIVELGSKLILVAALFQLFDGMQVAGTAILRGAGDTRIPMFLAGFGYWLVGLPVGYLLGFRTDLGPVGVWLGLSVGLALVAVMLGFRVRRLIRGGADQLTGRVGPDPGDPDPDPREEGLVGVA